MKKIIVKKEINIMKKNLYEARKKRILARGEHSNHCHVLIGDNIEILPNNDFIVKEGSTAKIRHLLESIYLESGKEVHTGEHQDIILPAGKYRYVPQIELNPYDQRFMRVQD